MPERSGHTDETTASGTLVPEAVVVQSEPEQMSDPTPDDAAPGERTRSRPWTRTWFWVAVILVASVAISLAADTPWFTTVLALLLGFVIIRTGLFFLQSFATPPPPPPDPGTLRKVKLVYRCNVCGAEVRMTAATTEDPEPPRHCMDDMALVSPIE